MNTFVRFIKYGVVVLGCFVFTAPVPVSAAPGDVTGMIDFSAVNYSRKEYMTATSYFGGGIKYKDEEVFPLVVGGVAVVDRSHSGAVPGLSVRRFEGGMTVTIDSDYVKGRKCAQGNVYITGADITSVTEAFGHSKLEDKKDAGFCRILRDGVRKVSSSQVYFNIAAGPNIDSFTIRYKMPVAAKVNLKVAKPGFNPEEGPITIPYGTAATLSWATTNAQSCWATGAWAKDGWNDWKAAQGGTESTGNLTSSKTYTIQCWSDSGLESPKDSVTVNVSAPPNPTVDLKASSGSTITDGTLSIQSGNNATLSWTSTNTATNTLTPCTASSSPTGWSGKKASSGNDSTGNITGPATKTYTLTCTGIAGGSATDSVTVSVSGPPTADLKVSAPGISISDTAITIGYNTAATLTWTSANATSCTGFSGSNNWSGGGKATSGSFATGNLTSSTTYIITCGTNSGSASPQDSVTVNVSPAPAANNPPTAAAKISINNAAAASTVTVTRGVAVSVSLDASSSSDPDGWTASGKGVSTGTGKCQWNSDLNQGTATYESTIPTPSSPASCNLSLGNLTFQDNPGTYTYNLLRITDAAGAVSNIATASVIVTAAPVIAAPTVDLTFNDVGDSVTINSGTGGTLKWTSTNTNPNTSYPCTASNAWSGSKLPSGSASVVSLTASKTYTIVCSSASGAQATDSVTVNVNAPATAATVDLVGPVSVPYNTAGNLTWTSTNATSCAPGSWSTSTATSGSGSTGILTTAKTFSITCTGPGGSGSDSVTVNVEAAPAAPTVRLTADSSTVAYNGSTTLRWTTTNVRSTNSCLASGGWRYGDTWRNSSGSEDTGNLTSSRTFTLTCYATNGLGVQASVTVNIDAPAPASITDIKAQYGSNPPSGDSITIPMGSAATLSWTSPNAVSCWATGGWNGISAPEYGLWKSAPTGSESTGSLTSAKTYYIQCYNAVGVATLDSVTVNVSAAVPPTPIPGPTVYVDLKMNGSDGPVNVKPTDPQTLTWLTQNATFGCWAGPYGSGWYNQFSQVYTSGSRDFTGNPSITYSLWCMSVYGTSGGDSVKVNVIRPPTVDLKINYTQGPAIYPAGSRPTIILSWESTDTTSCTASSGTGDSFSGSKGLNGGEGKLIDSSQTYTLTCAGPGGSVSDTVQAIIGSAPFNPGGFTETR